MMRETSRTKKTVYSLIAVFFMALFLYAWTGQWRLSCLLGESIQVNFGMNTVRMTACWYPIHIGQEGTSVSLIGRKIHPFKEADYVDIMVPSELNRDFRGLVTSSHLVKKYSWGTAVYLDKNWMYALMNRGPSPEISKAPTLAPAEQITVFVPEKNVLVRASRSSDLDEIISIGTRAQQ